LAQAIAGNMGGQPILILKEGSSESKGREAQHRNIMAAKIIAEAVKSSLGPKGMDKMLVDGMGDVTITNDGATILKEMDVQHPVAKIMVEVAKTTDQEVGDGTTSAAILAGELLTNAENLLEQGVHPTIIIGGYREATEKALKFGQQIAMTVNPTDKEVLRKVGSTSLASKMVSEHKDYLSDLGVQAILHVAEKQGDKYKVELDDVKVEKKPGKSLGETELIKGIVLDKEVVHSGMPRRIDNAKIALLNCALEIEKTEFDAKINIQSPEKLKEFLDAEQDMLKDMADKIAGTGANVVICQKGIDDAAQHYLAKAGILAVRRVKESDMNKLAKATGGHVINAVNALTKGDLGWAKTVEERKIEEDKWTFIEDCKNPKSVTLLIRGGTKKVIEEAERAMHDVLSVVRDVVVNPKIVAGGGAPEIEIASKLKGWAEKLSGREQLAVQEFAKALEAIPTTLAQNAGLDPIDVLVELRSKHQKGMKWTGVDVFGGKVSDMEKLDIYEPFSVKEQIIKSASEAATMILRIDDVIASGKSKMPAGPPPGAGEMPPGMPLGEY